MENLYINFFILAKIRKKRNFRFSNFTVILVTTNLKKSVTVEISYLVYEDAYRIYFFTIRLAHFISFTTNRVLILTQRKASNALSYIFNSI